MMNSLASAKLIQFLRVMSEETEARETINVHSLNVLIFTEHLICAGCLLSTEEMVVSARGCRSCPVAEQEPRPGVS